MKLTARSTLADVAMGVGDQLRRAGIRAVLTGGACTSLWTRGAHHSLDAEFVLIEACSVADPDQALARLGFKRRRSRHSHARVPFIVEFARGPLGNGEDFRVRPVWVCRCSVMGYSRTQSDLFLVEGLR